jgi:hypothetical protein
MTHVVPTLMILGYFAVLIYTGYTAYNLLRLPTLNKEGTMRLTDEQRYRLERAKDQTPTTSAFVWVIPVFLFACWLCKTDAGQEVADQMTRQLATIQVDAPEVHFARQATHPDFSKYPNGDPVCGGDSWCVLGWHL